MSLRIKSGWKAFDPIVNVHKAKLDMTIRANVCNFTVLTAMLYVTEMWATTKNEEQRLLMAQWVILKIHAGNIVG